MNKYISVFLFVLLLSSCGLTNRDLGFEKTSPDEMLVVSRSPLSIPPEFDLRPVVDIENTLVEEDLLSSGEKELLSQM